MTQENSVLEALRAARSIWGNEAAKGVTNLKELLARWDDKIPLPQEAVKPIASPTSGRVSELDRFRAACEAHGREKNWLFLRSWVPQDGGFDVRWMLPDGSIHQDQGWQCLK